jgi:peptidase M23-like protein
VRSRLVAALVAAALIALVPAATAQAPGQARARAAVIDGTLGRAGFARAAGEAGERARVRSSDAPVGVALSSGQASVSAAGGTGSASAVARSVSLLGGAVTAYGVRRTASNTGGGPHYRGAVHGLNVLGRVIGDARQTHRYDLGGAGYLAVNRDGVGLEVVLSAPLNGFPAGTDVKVAEVSATVTAPRATPTPTPTATPTATPTRTPTATPAKPRQPAKPKPPSFRQRLAGPGFVFPVRGPTTIGGPFGAARADTGAHEGNDLFARFGTPVVAVHDGTIGRVGTLAIAGNRLWLTTPHGDAFFYAHLSAFSPAAVDGNRVKAGTVLGYVGNTGDAEPTPPHLHFEIHPDGGAAVDPHPTLVIWQARAHFPAPDTATRPGALLEVRDLIADG